MPRNSKTRNSKTADHGLQGSARPQRPRAQWFPTMFLGCWASVVALVLGGLVVSPAAAQEPPAELHLSTLLPANGGNGTKGFVLNALNPDDVLGSIALLII